MRVSSLSLASSCPVHLSRDLQRDPTPPPSILMKSPRRLEGWQDAGTIW